MKKTNKLLTIGFLAISLVLVSQITTTSTVLAQNYVCSSDTDCGNNRFVDQQFCQGKNLQQNYIAYTCNNPRTTSSNCTSSKSPQLVQICANTCEDNLWYIGCSSKDSKNISTPTYSTSAYQQCVGNTVYSFDSYGARQGIYQVCSVGQTCSGNSCIVSSGNSVTSTNYVTRIFKGCVGNISYWYDSLGNQKDVYQNCSATGQVCQNGGCIGNGTTVTANPTTNTSANTATTATVKHFKIGCYDNSVYWYNSKGVIEDVYNNCSDSNSCTVDACTESKCQNELKCDGSTCGIDSEDYAKYCSNIASNNNSNLTAAVSENSFANFFKRWYGWGILILILIILFIVIFRRLSSNN